MRKFFGGEMTLQMFLSRHLKDTSRGVRLIAAGFYHRVFIEGQTSLGWVVGVREVQSLQVIGGRREVVGTIRDCRFPFYLCKPYWKGRVTVDITSSLYNQDWYFLELWRNGLPVAHIHDPEPERAIRRVVSPF